MGGYFCEVRHPGTDKLSVDMWDLMKHNWYYLLAAAAMIMDNLTKDNRYERHVVFLKFVFVWGVLTNCFIFNLQPVDPVTGFQDRSFHWYSVALAMLSVAGAANSAYPDFIRNIKTGLKNRFLNIFRRESS